MELEDRWIILGFARDRSVHFLGVLAGEKKDVLNETMRTLRSAPRSDSTPRDFVSRIVTLDAVKTNLNLKTIIHYILTRRGYSDAQCVEETSKILHSYVFNAGSHEAPQERRAID